MPLQFFKFRELPLLFVYLEPCHYYFISTRLVPFCTLDAALGPHADRTRHILLLRAHLQTVWLKVPLAKNEPRESGLIHSPSLTDRATPRVRRRPSPPLSPSPPLPFLLLRCRREAQHEWGFHCFGPVRVREPGEPAPAGGLPQLWMPPDLYPQQAAGDVQSDVFSSAPTTWGWVLFNLLHLCVWIDPIL